MFFPTQTQFLTCRLADRAREIYQMGFEFYGQDEEGIDKSQSLYSAFAKMEVRHKEYDRARVIYKVRLALESLSLNEAPD